MTIAIAAAMAGASIEAAAAPAQAARADMARRVRDRFRGRTRDEETLARAAEAPDEPGRLEALEGAVRQVLDEDPEFGTEIQKLWNQAQTRADASDDGVVNVFNGSAEKVVQFRDLNVHHGGLNL